MLSKGLDCWRGLEHHLVCFATTAEAKRRTLYHKYGRYWANISDSKESL